jgi:hypothetical protein
MKKTITLLLIFLTFGISKATEPEDGFCLNKAQGQDLQVVDIWLVYTSSLKNNPVLGQFLKFGTKASLEANALTEMQAEEFILSYSEKFKIGLGNYFLIKKNNSFFILSINRQDKKLFFELKSLDEVITSENFIYIMIPKKESV